MSVEKKSMLIRLPNGTRFYSPAVAFSEGRGVVLVPFRRLAPGENVRDSGATPSVEMGGADLLDLGPGAAQPPE